MVFLFDDTFVVVTCLYLFLCCEFGLNDGGICEIIYTVANILSIIPILKGKKAQM
jgi:hypothetical protein